MERNKESPLHFGRWNFYSDHLRYLFDIISYCFYLGKVIYLIRGCYPFHTVGLKIYSFVRIGIRILHDIYCCGKRYIGSIRPPVPYQSNYIKG